MVFEERSRHDPKISHCTGVRSGILHHQINMSDFRVLLLSDDPTVPNPIFSVIEPRRTNHHRDWLPGGRRIHDGQYVRSYFEGLITSGLVGGLCSFASAANVTMIGMISDSAFGASHANTIAARKDTKMKEQECRWHA